MIKPLVSVITTTYNHEKYIRKCIESVISQTYSNWEMIIIDDGSTDNTPKIAEEYTNKDNRIYYIRQKHRGVWKLRQTYNRGLKYANGEIVAILEGDDFWPTYKLEHQIREFNKKDIILCFGKAAIYSSRHNKIINIIPKNIRNEKFQKFDITKKLIIHGNFIPAVTVMVRRDVIDDIGGFKQASYTPYIDYPTWLELSLLGQFKAVNKILGYWRKHNNQITNKYYNYMYNSGEKLIMDFFRALPSNLQYIIDLEYEDVLKIINKRISMKCYTYGKNFLLNREYELAKKYFTKGTISSSDKETKIKNIVGLIFSYLQSYYSK